MTEQSIERGTAPDDAAAPGTPGDRAANGRPPTDPDPARIGEDGERARADRNPTDEPDGTPAYAASMRPPGSSVSTGTDRADSAWTGTDDPDKPWAGADDADADPDGFDTDPDADDAGGVDRFAGYDADAVSGDTEASRPE